MSQVLPTSSQTANTTTGTLTITKPASLAVGDTLVVHIYAEASAIALPTGWTAVQNTVANSRAIAIFSKIADSTDVAAANFAFTLTGNTAAVGALSRWQSAGSVPVDQSHLTTTTGGLLPTDTGISPTIYSGTFCIATFYDSASASRSVSTYAIATTNPTWTELYDVSAAIGGTNIGVALAYGSRYNITATGNASATLSGASDASALAIFNLVPALSAIGSLTLNAPRPKVPVIINAGLRLSLSLNATSVPTSRYASQYKSTAGAWTSQSKS